MNVETIMSKTIHTCSPEDSLERVAQILWDGDCGCVPVVNDEHRVVGMVTDRDACMAAYTQGARLCDIPVSTAMAGQVRSCRPSDSVTSAEQTLREYQLHRLPVVDDQERLVGLLSLGDIAREAAHQRNDRRPAVTDKEVGETLASVSAARSRSRELEPVAA